MTKLRFAVALTALFCAFAVTHLVTRAADHADGAVATNDPAADIGDVYTWMSPDARFLNLVMGVGGVPASASVQFSDAAQYVFHTTSKASFGASTAVGYDIICEFASNQEVRCWAGTDIFMGGNANSSAGITSSDGRMKVATGTFSDPFFFNLTGFNETRRLVGTAAPALRFDAAGCPQLDAATSSALVGQLRSAPGGGAAADAFLTNNQQFLVVQIDKSLVTRGGPIVGVWGSTHRR